MIFLVFVTCVAAFIVPSECLLLPTNLPQAVKDCVSTVIKTIAEAKNNSDFQIKTPSDLNATIVKNIKTCVASNANPVIDNRADTWWRAYIVNIVGNKTEMDYDEDFDAVVDPSAPHLQSHFRGRHSLRENDLRRVSNEILNYFNARNVTGLNKVSEYLDRIYDAINKYFYNKNNSLHFGPETETDRSLEDVFLTILRYTDYTRNPGGSQFDAAYFLLKLHQTLIVYEKLQKKKEEERQRLLQEKLRLRLFAILETMKKFIQISKEGNENYDDQMQFLEEVFKTLMIYEKYRLNISHFSELIQIESEDTLYRIFNAIREFRLLKDNNVDLKQLKAALHVVLSKIRIHLSNITHLPSPNATDSESTLLLILQKLLVFNEMHKPVDTEGLTKILTFLMKSRTSSDSQYNTLKQAFEALLKIYSECPRVISADPYLTSVFISLANYIRYSQKDTFLRVGIDPSLKKVFLSIVKYLQQDNQNSGKNISTEIPIIKQILQEILRYKIILYNTALNDLLIEILNLTTSSRPITDIDHSNNLLNQIFALLLKYLKPESVVSDEIQLIINQISQYVNTMNTDPNPEKLHDILKRIFELIDTNIKRKVNDLNQTETEKHFVQVLRVLQQFNNNGGVVTEKITDLTNALRLILSQVSRNSLGSRNMVQILGKLLSVFNYINNGGASIDPTPYLDIFIAISEFIRQVNLQPDLNDGENKILMEDIVYAIQVFLNHRQDGNPDNADESTLVQILEGLMEFFQNRPLIRDDKLSKYLDAIFTTIRDQKYNSASEIINAILEVVLSINNNNPLTYKDLNYNDSLLFWQNIFDTLLNKGNSRSIPLAYLQRIFRILMEYLNNANTVTPEQYLGNIIEVIVKYENYKYKYKNPNVVIEINGDKRSLWKQILDLLLNPHSVSMNVLDNRLKKLYEILLNNNVQHNPFAHGLTKTLLKVYNILQRQNHQFGVIVVKLTQYVNILLDRLSRLVKQSVVDEKAIVQDLIIAVSQKEVDDTSDGIKAFDEIVAETVYIIKQIETGNLRKVAVNIVRVTLKYFTLTKQNVIQVINTWTNALGEDAERIIIDILIALKPQRFDVKLNITGSNSHEIFLALVNDLLNTVKTTGHYYDTRSIVVLFVNNVITNIQNAIKNRQVITILDTIVKVVQNYAVEGKLDVDVLYALQLIIGGRALPGSDDWRQLIRTMKEFTSGSNSNLTTNGWHEISEVLDLVIKGKDTDTYNYLSDLINIFNANVSTNRQNDATHLVALLITVKNYLINMNGGIRGPWETILSLVTNVSANDIPLLSNSLVQILNVLRLIVDGNLDMDGDLQNILNIVLKQIEHPDTGTSKEKISEVLAILKVLIKDSTDKPTRKAILDLVISLLSYVTLGNPWEELLEILKPLFKDHPENAIEVVKMLKLIIDLKSNSNQNVDLTYQQIFKILMLLGQQNSGRTGNLISPIKMLINFLRGTNVGQVNKDVLNGILTYLELVYTNGNNDVINPHKLLKLLTQTVITIDKYVNVGDINSEDTLVRKLLQEVPVVAKKHYSYIEDKNLSEKDVLANIIKDVNKEKLRT